MALGLRRLHGTQIQPGVQLAISGGTLWLGVVAVLAGRHLFLTVLPLCSVARNDTGLPPKAIAALFVRKVEADIQSGGEIIARTFDLTPAELRVLRAIADGGGVADASATLGIAETTVKTHLHRVFAKTGASRQADLVKLVAGYANPLVH